MDRIVETPLKRRKTEAGHVPASSGYDSQDDSVDELFTDYHDLVPQDTLALSSSPAPYVTQPTQLIGERAPQVDGTIDNKPMVQVVASSPVKTPNAPVASISQRGGILASAMAPPGTTFRAPAGVQQPPPQKKRTLIELSDDDEGMKYQGPSSDEDTQKDRRDIKPSVVKSRSEAQGARKFDEIMKNSVYTGSKPVDNKGQGQKFSGSVFDSRNRDEGNTSSKIGVAQKRPVDGMAYSDGTVRKRIKRVAQTMPAKAQPVQDITLDDIPDAHLRKKAQRMKEVLPAHSIRLIKEALVQKGGNENDAMDLLASKEPLPDEIDLTRSSEDELAKNSPAKPKVQAKQQLKVPARTIQEKYGLPSQSQAQPSKDAPIDSSLALPTAKPRRRLMKGRKQRSQPSSPVLAPQRSETPVSIDSDSGVASEVEDNTTFDGNLLGFFNTCSVGDLCDLAAIQTNIAELIISQRPFRSFSQVRKVSEAPAQTSKTGRKSTKRPIGERILDVCERMWTGYQAVDQLVHRCTELGKPVANEMKKWGVDVFGTSTDGEVALTSFHDDEKSDPSLRDSGIGTPASYVNSASEDGDDDIKKASDAPRKPKTNLFGQPSVMSKDITLKDYQIVGINWLSLLFENKLSCILAGGSILSTLGEVLIMDR